VTRLTRRRRLPDVQVVTLHRGGDVLAAGWIDCGAQEIETRQTTTKVMSALGMMSAFLSARPILERRISVSQTAVFSCVCVSEERRGGSATDGLFPEVHRSGVG